MDILLRKLPALKLRAGVLTHSLQHLFSRRKFISVLMQIKSIGRSNSLEPLEKRKLAIFNLLNFLQVVTGMLVPLTGYITSRNIGNEVWLVCLLPTLVSAISLYLNYYRKYELSLISYFILYPFVTCVVYLNGINLGADLSFVLYGILSVFFLQEIGYMLFSIAFSMLSYFIIAVVLSDFRYDMREINQPFFYFNQLLTIAYIFYGLWHIKKENAGYQLHILSKNNSLQQQNERIAFQKKEIFEKAKILRAQKIKLSRLNNVKDKLFSVISHDLKTPMYGMRNLFTQFKQQNLPAKEIKATIPHVLNDINYSISLMENLLHWAKSQMALQPVRKEPCSIYLSVDSIISLLDSQARSKKIVVENKVDESLLLIADRDAVNLVLRNLLTNAIKFTPIEGNIIVGMNDHGSHCEIYVKDSGVGISKESISKILEHSFYTTPGTTGEPGSGLGLMLCQQYLKSMGSHLEIKGEAGKGSIFSFRLQKEQNIDQAQVA